MMTTIRVTLSIGYPGANIEDKLHIPDVELDRRTPEKKTDLIQEYVDEWKAGYIECWWELMEDQPDTD